MPRRRRFCTLQAECAPHHRATTMVSTRRRQFRGAGSARTARRTPLLRGFSSELRSSERAHTRARTRARMHTRTRTYTHSHTREHVRARAHSHTRIRLSLHTPHRSFAYAPSMHTWVATLGSFTQGTSPPLSPRRPRRPGHPLRSAASLAALSLSIFAALAALAAFGRYRRYRGQRMWENDRRAVVSARLLVIIYARCNDVS